MDLSQTPIERLTASGIQTTDRHYDLDLIVYATGFDAITGAFDRVDIRGVSTAPRSARNGVTGPSTYCGLLSHGFPNMLMVAGPQSVVRAPPTSRGPSRAGSSG